MIPSHRHRHRPFDLVTCAEQLRSLDKAVDALKRVFLKSCKAKDLTRARALYTTADANTRRGMLSLCANNGVRPETFDSL